MATALRLEDAELLRGVLGLEALGGVPPELELAWVMACRRRPTSRVNWGRISKGAWAGWCFLAAISWGRLVIDEAQQLKTPCVACVC